MSIQPGVGYTFTSSSLGTNFNIEKPWSEWDPTSAAVDQIVQQFQLRSVRVGTANKLQMAKGTVSFTQSNMPRVRLGGHYDQRQAWINKVAVYGSGVSRTAGTGSPVWMEAGGYFNITTAGTYYVTISKFDINQSNDDTESALLNAETPWVSIFPAGDAIESAIFSETGPSEYVNKTNVHKMTGYDAMSTGLSGDWGNCHTTWFNPTKWGYAVKLIATVTVTAVGEGVEFAIDQHIVGPIDLNIPCLFNGTTLCNQDDLNESNDPYNVNKDTTPKAWADIVNSETLDALEEITPANEDWFQEFVGPADWTSLNYSYLLPSSCAAQDDDPCFPFKIKDITTVGTGEGAYVTYKVCPGTLNNLMPQAYDTINEVWEYIDELETDAELVLNFTAGECWIVLRSGPDPSTNDYPQQTPGSIPEDDPYPRIFSQGTDPAGTDTDELAYLVLAKVTEGVGGTFTVDQYVTGSLWADRIKLGTQTAQYYYARI